MHTTKKLYSKTLVSLALLGLTSVAFANDPSTGNLVNSSQSQSMRVLLKEPGGLGYAERNTYQKTTSGNDGYNSILIMILHHLVLNKIKMGIKIFR
jgi:copper resistance protein B